MEQQFLPINEGGVQMPYADRANYMSAYFVQKPVTPHELIAGAKYSQLKVYPGGLFLPGWNIEEIALDNNIIRITGDDSRTNKSDDFIRLESPLSLVYNDVAKRLADIIISGFLILTVLSWLIPILGVLIKFDSSGPVLFVQKRNKKGGKIFNCLKFRSMFLNPESDSTATFKDDPRITRVGLIIRRYHLDELPQLINVFKGDMSIVGPRPHMIAENIRYKTFISGYNSRHQVKPGITGLAQSMGYHGSTAKFYQISGRLKLDKMYIQQWSFALDIRILLKTVRLLFIK